MRFVVPVLGFLMGALLVLDFYSLWPRPIETDLPKISRPNLLPTASPAPTPPVLAPAMQNQSAVEPQAAERPSNVATTGEAPQESAQVQPAGQSAEVPAEVEAPVQAAAEEPAKIEPAARAARAQSSPVKKRLAKKDRIYLQNHPLALDPNSFVNYMVLGRVY